MIDSLLAGTLLTSLLLGTLWGGLALGHQLPVARGVRWLAVLVWLGSGGLWCLLVWQGARLAPLAGMTIQMVTLLAWWRQLQPAMDLDWADDVAHLATGEVAGHRLILHHVRDFDWQTPDRARIAWEQRDYDLRALDSVDLFVSGWGRPGIAHVLISFGFLDPGTGRLDFLAFSVEVRRERNEAFSEIGGFFKQYELAIIAADERDAVRLRSNVRGERVTLYRVLLNAADRRDLLLALVEEANRLESAPRFYHTITANCTTLVFAMMRRIIERLPMDHRLLLTGLLPGYVHDHGGLVEGVSLSELKRHGDITERARVAHDAADFSRCIRQGVPGWE
ncbi:Lnb N-terminal periplasmic domain-containing protein [Halomonas sp. MA07-2]|uniref:Lnb N-terminal periplasmic domain-containing protein n=1 Tax=Halomonas sp. MA07-2 TaxID=3440841 RepID=UPI003EED05F1